jgi:DNA-directed RNA polymerase subunit RPC12/RpoP
MLETAEKAVEEKQKKSSASKTAACPTCGAKVMVDGKETQGQPCPECAKKNPVSTAPAKPQPTGAVPPAGPKPANVPQTGPVKHYGSKKLQGLWIADEE